MAGPTSKPSGAGGFRGREVVQQALRHNPQFFGTVYSDPIDGPKAHEAVGPALRRLRGIGDTAIVVEHDADRTAAVDRVVELGASAGVHGSLVVAQRTLREVPSSTTPRSRGASAAGASASPCRPAAGRAPAG